MSRVAVVGGGAIGGYLSALAHDAGHDVTLCVRTPLDRLVVERDGEVRPVPVAIVTQPGGMPPVDWLLLAVKAQDTAGTLGWLSALAGPRTVVVVAQNGIGHRERVEPLAPRSSILPVLIQFTIEPLGPGHIRHSVGNRIVAPADPLGKRFAALMEPSGVEFAFEDDFLTAAWRKLLGNVLANPVTALTLRRSEVFHDEDVQRMGRILLAEAIAVGRAEGARFADDELDRTMELFRHVPPQNGTSMLFDRLAGRPLEHEQITGAVVAAAGRHGIPTPANDVILTLLRAVDGGIRAGIGQGSGA
jgi:2-dehydropantoate 2-reductase